eukprot:15284060-Heterocapsa_arctica.AAC.1
MRLCAQSPTAASGGLEPCTDGQRGHDYRGVHENNRENEAHPRADRGIAERVDCTKRSGHYGTHKGDRFKQRECGETRPTMARFRGVADGRCTVVGEQNMQSTNDSEYELK